MSLMRARHGRRVTAGDGDGRVRAAAASGPDSPPSGPPSVAARNTVWAHPLLIALTVGAASLEAGIIVLCTNMAGSVPEAADLVVTDSLEAGIMAVMLIADTARFDIDRVRGKRY